MKKLLLKLNFAIVGIMATGVANAAKELKIDESALCELFEQFGGIFSILRTLSFVGAAFVLAGWAWNWISGGKDGKSTVNLDDVKTKGIGMLVGFVVLFGVGAIVTVFMNMAGAGGSLGCDVGDYF